MLLAIDYCFWCSRLRGCISALADRCSVQNPSKYAISNAHLTMQVFLSRFIVFKNKLMVCEHLQAGGVYESVYCMLALLVFILKSSPYFQTKRYLCTYI